MKPFNLSTCPLEGVNLVEASAGTGKTYNIAGIYLRLILEKRLLVNQVLVVTFTEAATEELRERIRKILHYTKNRLSGHSPVNPEYHALEHILNTCGDKEEAAGRLGLALQMYDEAAIYTIHGFCRRMLFEYSFESGTQYHAELAPDHDQENINRESARDFWRKYLVFANPLFVEHVLRNHVDIDRTLVPLIKKNIHYPGFKIIPGPETVDLKPLEDRFSQMLKDIRGFWKKHQGTILAFLQGSDDISHTSFSRPAAERWCRELHEWLDADIRYPAFCNSFNRFTINHVEKYKKKRSGHTAWEFFQRCQSIADHAERIQQTLNTMLAGFKASFINFYKKDIETKKQERNVQFYDDLLIKLKLALEKKNSCLAGAIRSKYHAALIDEFQDTDPIQFKIFRTVFDPDYNTALFLIGDPKQAIYRFRGADLNTYLNACSAVSESASFTLEVNYRSQENLVHAVNTVFSGDNPPFVNKDILCNPCRAHGFADAENALTIDGNDASGMHVHFLPKAVKVGKARQLIARYNAGLISNMVRLGQQGRARIGNRPLSPGHIAVLVRKHIQAKLMKKAIEINGIPCVLHSMGNLFETDEAFELEKILFSFIFPGRAGNTRAALSTQIMGVDGNTLHALAGQGEQFEEHINDAYRYHHIWKRKGFTSMFRQLITDKHLRARLLGLPQGERILTNLLHLGEVLGRAETDNRLSMHGLLKWLAKQRDLKEDSIEEHQLRLERDENAVKIVTIFKSKGLQYPVVFCPFSWTKPKRINEDFTFHDKAMPTRLILDLGSDRSADHLSIMNNEMLAENVRLLYVALTRAVNACHFSWGKINTTEDTAPAYVFHRPQGKLDPDTARQAAMEKVGPMSEQEMFDHFKNLSLKSKGAITVNEIGDFKHESFKPELDKKQKYTLRVFKKSIPSDWKIASFSSLVAQIPYSEDIPDWDEISREITEEASDASGSSAIETIHDFPSSARIGSCIHAVFEDLDYTEENSAAIRDLVAEKLNGFGLGTDGLKAVLNMVKNVLSCPLKKDLPDFTLSNIRKDNRINEMAFHFPIKKLNNEILASVFKTSGKLEFDPMKGYIKGFIDLVFMHNNMYYIVDWKSNRLGRRIEEYNQENLNNEMIKDFYMLQYHLYSVALDKYLKYRLRDYDYESHFGGVFYVFLRGVDPAMGPDYGIYFDKPSKALVGKLSREIME
jgi:exodeoxyribonuclease V beta subunit